jgi:hypothetical protein
MQGNQYNRFVGVEKERGFFPWICKLSNGSTYYWFFPALLMENIPLDSHGSASTKASSFDEQGGEKYPDNDREMEIFFFVIAHIYVNSVFSTIVVS